MLHTAPLPHPPPDAGVQHTVLWNRAYRAAGPGRCGEWLAKALLRSGAMRAWRIYKTIGICSGCAIAAASLPASRK